MFAIRYSLSWHSLSWRLIEDDTSSLVGCSQDVNPLNELDRWDSSVPRPRQGTSCGEQCWIQAVNDLVPGDLPRIGHVTGIGYRTAAASGTHLQTLASQSSWTVLHSHSV